MSIRICTAADVPQIFAIVNDAARAYKGIIPADRWHEPYVPEPALDAVGRASTLIRTTRIGAR